MYDMLGDIPPDQWQAVVRTFDANGDGNVQYEELFDAVRRFKARKRKGEAALGRGMRKDPSSLVKSYTFKGQSARRNYNDNSARGTGWLQRTDLGTFILRPDPNPPLAKLPSAAITGHTKQIQNVDLSDWAGTEGGPTWLGRPRFGPPTPARAWPKRAATPQPHPAKPLYPKGRTYSEEHWWQERKLQGGPNAPANRAAWKPRRDLLRNHPDFQHLDDEGCQAKVPIAKSLSEKADRRAATPIDGNKQKKTSLLRESATPAENTRRTTAPALSELREAQTPADGMPRRAKTPLGNGVETSRSLLGEAKLLTKGMEEYFSRAQGLENRMQKFIDNFERTGTTSRRREK